MDARVGLNLGTKGICETFMDHDFTRAMYVDRGRHPQRGPYETLERTCRKCGRKLAETRWLEEKTAARGMGMYGDSAEIAQALPLSKTTEED